MLISFSLKVLHQKATTWSDKIAYGLVKFSRATFDFVSGYKHPTVPPSPDMTVEQLRKAGYLLDDRAWLTVCNPISCPYVHSCSSHIMPAHSLLGEHCWRAGYGGCNPSPSDKFEAYGTHWNCRLIFFLSFCFQPISAAIVDGQ